MNPNPNGAADTVLIKSNPSAAGENTASPSPLLPFDKAATALLKKAAQQVLGEHPEVRSVIMILDYKGSLNDADVDKALWIGESGQVTQLDAMFGAVAGLMRVMNHVMARIDQVAANMRDEAQIIGTELVHRRKEQHGSRQNAGKADESVQTDTP